MSEIEIKKTRKSVRGAMKETVKTKKKLFKVPKASAREKQEDRVKNIKQKETIYDYPLTCYFDMYLPSILFGNYINFHTIFGIIISYCLTVIDVIQFTEIFSRR